MAFPASIPERLRIDDNWTRWRRESVEGRPKPTKVPYQVRHPDRKTSTTDPRTWAPFAEALAACPEPTVERGIGYVFAGNGIVGIDLDECIPEGARQMDPWAVPLVQRFNSYTELSPSGRGVHILIAGKMPGKGHRRVYRGGEVEAYDRGRYFTMTGSHLRQTPLTIEDRQAELLAFCEEMWPKKLPQVPPPIASLSMEDREVIDHLRRARNNADFARLYDFGELTGHANDHSRADLALANMFAFYTQDAAQLERLMRTSALRRDKWESSRPGGTWLSEYAVAPAIRDVTATYDPRRGSKGGTSTAEAVHDATRRENAARRELEALDNGREPSSAGLPETYTAQYLETAVFKEPKWIIPGILCEGLCLLVGPPKGAKSALALGTAIATAAGGYALGKFPVEQGPVLYLALEDIKRRMQDRMRKMLKGARAPADLYFAHRWPKAGEQGGHLLIARWVETHPGTRLVIVDTAEKFRDRRRSQGNAYAEDYQFMERLQDMAHDLAICLLLIHHTNKRPDPVDPFHSVSGTEGMSGGADTTLLLRRPRGERLGKLFVTSRDVQEDEYDVEFDGETMSWLFRGKAGEGPKTHEQAEVLKVIATFRVPVTPRDVHFKMTELGSRRTQNSVKAMMWRLFQEGQLTLHDKGAYSLPQKN